MKKATIIFLFLTFNYSITYCIDFNIAVGRAQSHQKEIKPFNNTFTFSLGADYLKKEKLFLRTNATYQLYNIESEQLYDLNYLAVNSLVCFPFLNDSKAMLYFGLGLQSSFLLSDNIGNSNEEINTDPLNFGAYAQMGGYLKLKRVYLGLIFDACYYFGGVGEMESFELPGVCSAQYLSLIIPLNYEK